MHISPLILTSSSSLLRFVGSSFTPAPWRAKNRAQFLLPPVLRLPRYHGERRTGSDFAGELGAAKINLLPLGWGK
jgi:hypothetical protein